MWIEGKNDKITASEKLETKFTAVIQRRSVCSGECNGLPQQTSADE